MPSASRKRARKTEPLAGAGPFPRARLRRRPAALLAVCPLFVAAATVLINLGQGRPEVSVGQRAGRTLLARVAFQYPNPGRTRLLQDEARAAEPNVYRPAAAWLDRFREEALDLAAHARAAETLEQVPAPLREAWKLTGGSGDHIAFVELRLVGFADKLNELIGHLQNRHVIDGADLARERREGRRRVVVLPPAESEPEPAEAAEPARTSVPLAELIPTDEPAQIANWFDGAVGRMPALDADLRRMLKGWVLAHAEPTVRLDRSATAAARSEAAARVSPQFVAVPADTVLIPQGSVVTQEQYAVLVHELRWHRQDAPWAVAGRWVGTGVLVAVMTGLFVGYVGLFGRREIRHPVREAAVGASLVLGMLGVSRWLAVSGQPLMLLCLAACFPAMVLAVAYARRLALAALAFQVALICLAAEASVSVALVLAAGSGAAVFDLGDIRNRSKLIRTGMLSAGAFLVAVLGTELADAQPWPYMMTMAAWAGGCGVAAGFLVLGLLPFVERLFGVCTSVSLLELCDPNQPLLRRLALEAPGTYNHSLQMGAMSEAAAENVGANGLLARVGSYFHDIGKISKPHYFIENRTERQSRHETLSPAMSTLVIIAHAREGLEMAREYGLPKLLHEFIETHHGNTVVQYFYEEARREDPNVSPDEFRYPGPKPTSKEAGIVMLADAVESATRTLSDPTHKRIESLVAELVQKRLSDGQLDECELTLAEVRKIQESLVKSLTAIYHGRIKYPSTRPEKEAARPASVG